jgi:16S rRNA (cytidine1402-2'-O)-methyltransferase
LGKDVGRLYIQKSFENGAKSALYVVGTPIGNLQDMTWRAVETLKAADLIAAEDTRQTRKLLQYFSISKRLISYHEHNKTAIGQEIVSYLKQGIKVALVSDAGMPAISDPGFELVTSALAAGFSVIPIPGANAAVTALVASGLPTDRFVFVGFLPRETKFQLKELERLKSYPETLIFYESPHRIEKTLENMRQIFGDRKICLARELTKWFEEFIRGTITEVLAQLMTSQKVRGELTIVVEGGSQKTNIAEEEWWAALDISAHVSAYTDQGFSVKEAIKKVALDRQLPKREVYRVFHGIQQSEPNAE